MNIGHVAPEIALVLGAVAVVLTAAFTSRERQWITTPIALLAVSASGIGSVVLATTTEAQITFDDTWALDPLTQGAELVIASVTAVTLLLSVDWFRTDPRRGEYPAVLLFAAAGAMLLAGAADTMELVVGMLLVSVAGYTLAAYHRNSPAALEAGMKYFLIGALTNTFLLVGVVLLYGAVGTTSYAQIATTLGGGADRIAVIAAVVCIIIGLAFEIGAVPAHAWLPDVAQGSPAPSAAFLTVAPKIGAVVALARILHVVPTDLVDWRPLVAVLAVLTMTMGNILALWQDDLRRLLGWSSISQAGYALMAVVVIDIADLAPSALIVFLAGYAAATVAAFAVVTELRGRTSIADYRGLSTRRPWLAVALAVALLSLVGIPPLGGFVGKLTLFTATIDGGYGWLAAVAAANTVISLFYYLRVITPMYHDHVDSDQSISVLGQTARLAVTAAAAATLAVGIAAEPLLSALDGAQLVP
ncbi:MAG: NADH-quinone oxidoreductase subunit N [Acidimicrobiales bacterium]